MSFSLYRSMRFVFKRVSHLSPWLLQLMTCLSPASNQKPHSVFSSSSFKTCASTRRVSKSLKMDQNVFWATSLKFWDGESISLCQTYLKALSSARETQSWDGIQLWLRTRITIIRILRSRCKQGSRRRKGMMRSRTRWGSGRGWARLRSRLRRWSGRVLWRWEMALWTRNQAYMMFTELT